jgi:hypothetical protein
MRIGSDGSFLYLEKVGQEGSTITWRVAAAVGGPGWRFTATHNQVQLDNTDETVSRTAEFIARKVQRIDVILREGGWLRIKRDPKGCILVRYRVGQMNTGTALEGEVSLQGESAEAFCQQFGGLL